MPSILAHSTVRLAALLAVEKVLPAGIASARVLALTTEGLQTMFWKKMIAVMVIVLTGSVLTATVLAQRTPAPATDEPSPTIGSAFAPEERLAPEPPREEKQSETPLEKVLRKWADADESVREIRLRFTRTEKDIFEKRTTKGQAFLKKPDLWRLDVLDKDGRLDAIVLREAKQLHFFDRQTKTEKRLPIPDKTSKKHESGMWFDLSSLLKNWEEIIRWLAFGPQARDVSPRFTVRLAKEDRYYSYLDITPRSSEDKKWIRRARVVLNHDGYHVRQLWMESPAGTENVVDYLDIQTNPRPAITRDSLLKTLPKGWKPFDPSVEPENKDG